jgi:hypothetical protein
MGSAAEAVKQHLGTDRGAATRLAVRLGCSRGFVSNVIKGRHLPSDPVRWADALGLTGEARAAFLRDVASDRQAPEVRQAIGGELDLVQARARVAALERELAELRSHMRAIASMAQGDVAAEDNLAATERAQRAPTQADDDHAARRRRRPFQFQVPNASADASPAAPAPK